MLEYDDSAFYYFAASFVMVVLVPTAWSIAKSLYRAFISPDIGPLKQARSEEEQAKVALLKQRVAPKTQVGTLWFGFRVLVLVVFGAVLVTLLQALAQDATLATWDPFDELGLTAEASKSEIKKAYRDLTLQYHPDKCKTELCAFKFDKVRQANAILTDETAKENWAKYGNPDGRQAMEVSIGLPSWLLESDKQKIVLLFYLVGLCVVLPTAVILYYRRSKLFGHKHIMHSTWAVFAKTINDNSTARSLPEILAAAYEFRSIPLRPEDEEDLAALEREFSREKSKDRQWKKPRYAAKNPFIRKGNLLLHAHMLNVELSDNLRGDLHRMLALAPRLLDAMMEFSRAPPRMPNQPPNQRPPAWANTMLSVVDLQQMLMQGLYARDSSLLQLPHFTAAEAKHASTGRGATKTLRDFLNAPAEDRKGMNSFSDAQKADVARVCLAMPQVEPDFAIAVKDEEMVGAGDVLTAFCKLTRTNVPDEDGAVAEPVYAPRFPEAVQEKWFFFVFFTPPGQVEPQLLGFAEAAGQGREVSAEVFFGGPPRAGSFTFEIKAKCNAYRGLDISQQVTVEVKPKEEVPEIEGHPPDSDEDEAGGSLYQSLMGLDDSSSEEDSDDEDAPAEQLSREQQRRREKRLAAKESSAAAAAEAKAASEAAAASASGAKGAKGGDEDGDYTFGVDDDSDSESKDPSAAGEGVRQRK